MRKRRETVERFSVITPASSGRDEPIKNAVKAGSSNPTNWRPAQLVMVSRFSVPASRW